MTIRVYGEGGYKVAGFIGVKDVDCAKCNHSIFRHGLDGKVIKECSAWKDARKMSVQIFPSRGHTRNLPAE